MTASGWWNSSSSTTSWRCSSPRPNDGGDTFALPILYGDRLVGKVDATADRKAGVLRVDAIHQDVPFTETMTSEVHREIDDLAHWLELELALPA